MEKRVAPNTEGAGELSLDKISEKKIPLKMSIWGGWGKLWYLACTPTLKGKRGTVRTSPQKGPEFEKMKKFTYRPVDQ